jgi:hypothetical protein
MIDGTETGHDEPALNYLDESIVQRLKTLSRNG